MFWKADTNTRPLLQFLDIESLARVNIAVVVLGQRPARRKSMWLATGMSATCTRVTI